MEINETPVRTAKNFNINNIKLDDIILPSSFSEFKNVKILCEDSKVHFDSNTSPISLTYGLSNELTNLVKSSSNSKVNVIIESKTNKDISINYDFSENDALLEDIEITAKEYTKETIIIRYFSKSSVFHDGIIRVNAKSNSFLNIVIVSLLDENSNNLLSIQNNSEESSTINYTIVDLGCIHSISNFYSNIRGNYAKNSINGIYIGRNNQILDLNYIAELYGEKNNVNIDFQGALLDNAKKHFKGTIDFKKGSKKSVGSENESCMLLSDTAKSLSLPMLLCSEEDVEGNHSSSAGKIDEKELFYVMSRGFDRKDAQKLMVRAKFNNILNKITNDGLKNEIIEKIDKKLES